jgi:thiamine-phosphate pyrophosphorylase
MSSRPGSYADRLRAARVYLVLEADAAARVARPALRGGVDLVQLRDKDAGDDAIVSAGRELRELCHAHGALFLINDRPDLAVACGADGVHVGQDDMPVDQARAIVGRDRIVGTSTHSPAQVDAADAADVDYFAVGPVFETPTKEGRPATGWDLIGYAAGRATKPWFAIGGMDPSTARAAAAAGAKRVVVVRAIRDASDPEAAARAVRTALDAGERVGAAR